MFVQFNNQIISLEAISYASIDFPGEHKPNQEIELSLIVSGYPLRLTGATALRLWHTLSRNSVGSLPGESLTGGSFASLDTPEQNPSQSTGVTE